MSLRTPLGKVRGLGSARSGTQHFWRQRVTAIANIPLVLFFAVIAVMLTGADHARVVAVLGHPLVATVFCALVVAVIWHGRLGMQVIIEDYVHNEGMKIACVMANTFFAAAMAVTGLLAIVKLAFGG